MNVYTYGPLNIFSVMVVFFQPTSSLYLLIHGNNTSNGRNVKNKQEKNEFPVLRNVRHDVHVHDDIGDPDHEEQEEENCFLSQNLLTLSVSVVILPIISIWNKQITLRKLHTWIIRGRPYITHSLLVCIDISHGFGLSFWNPAWEIGDSNS